MRTTLDLPDELYRQAKARAALEGLSIKSFITSLLEESIASANKQKLSNRIKLPLVPSKKPGSRKISGETIGKLLEEEDINVST